MALVTHKRSAHRGGKVAGPSGAIYWVHTTTGQLHLAQGDRAHPTPGVEHVADVAEFSQFPELFKVQEVAAKAPPPPVKEAKAPPPPAAAGGDEDPPPPAVTAQFPPPNATKATWVKWAEEHGVVVDAMEIEAHTKAELIEVIQERFAALGE